MVKTRTICRPAPRLTSTGIGVCLAAGLSLLALACVPVGAQEQKFIIMMPTAPVVAHSTALSPRSAARKRSRIPKKPLAVAKFVLSADQLFEPSKDRLTGPGEAKLKALEPILRSLGEHPIVIVGHCDSLGFESANKDLTQREAQRVKEWIVAHGLAKAEAISTMGLGSSQPVASEKGAGGKDSAAGRALNRRIEISIDPSKDFVPEKVLTAAKPAPETHETTADVLPPELQDSVVVDGRSMIPCTEEDLKPESPTDSQEPAAHHQVNTAEWGSGGTNFGNSASSFGGDGGGFGGAAGEYNAEGKRVVKITPDAGKLEQQRKETEEAQNEFGLWRPQ